jgi:class 3 adenylate cyclase/predicted ATPase
VVLDTLFRYHAPGLGLPIMDLGGWLRSLGLAQYEAAFRENAINEAILPKLTAEDLKDIGMTAVGHRRVLLDAIAALRDETPARQENARSAATEPADNPNRVGGGLPEAERRQLTVMFCDLVGSTALSARLDPEDLREVIGAYHRRCAEVIAKSGGFVAKYMGDGVLAYFGYPLAHEDDAERAVRAGLALVEAVPKLGARAEAALQVRIGIATGLVVVGDLLGEGAAQEQAVVGETPNLAARLQAAAAPDTIVIGPRTRRLVADLFEYHDLGAIEVKGFAAPVQAYQVVCPSAVESRFEALRPTRTPLVGRVEEFELLLRRWQQVKSGQGRVVLLTGEPGIGKSRITVALQEHLQGDPHTRLRYFCSPHHQDSALHPLISQLERAASFARDDTAEQKLAKLEALLAQSNAQPEEIGYIAELLSITNIGRYPLPDLSPQKRKEKTLTALLAQMERLAARLPVLAVYEDAHWIDPTTLDLLILTIEQVQRLPVLLLITARPEFKQPWPAYAHVTNVTIGRIAREKGASLIEQVTGSKSLPKEVTHQIIDRTDGVPLFIEELTKAVIESGVLTDAGDRYTVAGPLPRLAIPTSLNASLLARLDRLAPVREVAQIGAALGRQFSHEMMSAVAAMPQRQLDDSLEQLVRAELIFRRGTPPDAEYTFKHALVQDAAYATLLRSRRQQLHVRITATLEGQFPEIVETQPVVLAYHCTQAGLAERAITYLLKAGRQAMTRSAMTEAVVQLTQASRLVTDLPPGADRDQLEIDVQVALGGAFAATKGFSAPEVERSYQRARELCRDRPDHFDLPAVLFGLHLYHQHRSGTHVAYGFAEELLRLAEQRQDKAACALGHWRLALNAMWSGNQQSALTHFEQAIAFYDRAEPHPSVVVSLSDVRVTSLNFIPLVLLWRGDLDQAVTRSCTAFTAAHELGHAFTLCHVSHLNCWLHYVLGDPTLVKERAAKALKLSAESGFSEWQRLAEFWDGWALANSGEVTAGLAQMRDAVSALQAMGLYLQAPHRLGLLAELYTHSGSPAEALAVLTQALAIVDRTQERWFEAELHRLRAEAFLAQLYQFGEKIE